MSDTSEKTLAWEKYINVQLKDLTRTDAVRLQQLVEISQCTIVYVIVVLVLGRLLYKIFPNDTDKTVVKRSTAELITSVVSQSILFVLIVYYTHKIAKIVPLLIKLTDRYHYGTDEILAVAGGTITAVFFGKFVPSYGINIDELIKRYYNYLDSFNSSFI